MRKRPLALFLCASLFLYLPLETLWHWNQGIPVQTIDVVLLGALPLILLIGLVRVTKVGWYTLVALISLWGIRDLQQFYFTQGQTLRPLFIHLFIYGISVSYFINPRIRHLYFDPKMRWWRAKTRYETHLPFIYKAKEEWFYPILRNVSEGGCFIETPHLLEISDKIHLTIPLPVPLAVSVIKTIGEVRWVSKNPLRLGMGVQFLAAPAEQTRALKQFVQKKL